MFVVPGKQCYREAYLFLFQKSFKDSDYKKQPFPIYISKEKIENEIILLITKDQDKYYVLIKDFNKYVYNGTKHKNKKHFCMYLQCFKNETVLKKHNENCIIINDKQSVKMPEKI